MKWKKLLSGAGVLAICAALAKLLGAFYRIPLTNIMGAEGIGLYQMVFPLYTVLLTVSSGGLNSAISKVVAAELKRGDERGANKVLKIALYSLLLLSGVAAAVLLLFRRQIAGLQGNVLASYAYLGIAPAVILVAVICCFRGYFQGRGNMLPSGISQIIEQLVKLFAGLFLASVLLPRGVEYAVLGAVLGVTLSELAAMLILAAQFFITQRVRRKKTFVAVRRVSRGLESASDFVAAPAVRERTAGEILKKLYKIAVPVTLGSLIMPLTQVIDSVMVINVLTAAGMSGAAATSLFGLFSGPISSLINMPVAITLSISVALLPKIAFLSEGESEGGDIISTNFSESSGENGESGESDDNDETSGEGVAMVDNSLLYSVEFAADESAAIESAVTSSIGLQSSKNTKSSNKWRKNRKLNMQKSHKITAGNATQSKSSSASKSLNKTKKGRKGGKKSESAGSAAADALKLTMLLSLPAAALLMAFAPQIVTALYARGLSDWQIQISTSLLRIGSLSVVYIGFIQVATAVLQGADRPHKPAINLLYGAVTKVLLTLVLLPLLGIKGAAIASTICYGVIAIIDLIHMRQAVRVKMNIKKMLLIPLIGCAVMVGTIFLFLWIFQMFFSLRIAFIAAALLGALSYAAVLLLLKAISLKDFL